MKVSLFSIDPLDRGGAYTSALSVYTMLSEWGLEPRLLYLNAGLAEGLTPRELLRRGVLWDCREQERRGIPGIAVGHVAARAPALAYNWWPYPVVRRRMAEFDMHLVLGVPVCGVTAAFLGKPYVCWTATLLGDELQARADGGEKLAREMLASPFWRFLVWQERLVLRRAARILAVSAQTANRIRATVPDVASKVEVLSWPIDTATFRPEDAQKVSPPRSPWTIITVSRLDDPRKNIASLLRAMPVVRDALGDVRLKLVGAGADLGSTAAGGDAQDGVEVLGSLPRNRLVRELQAADLFVLTSYQEGLGLVVLEAMACGLPVVSTPSGGPEAHVREGVTGYLADGFGPVEIARALIRALSDSQQLATMGHSARRLVCEQNSHEVVASRLSATLKAVYPTFNGLG
jgi:glycosyltransferase involved in cell wall biosynthesis